MEGQKLGRELGFPTANMRPSPRQIVPPDGIYAVEVTLQNEKRYGGACSIGNRPTIEGAGRAIETYILDFTKDIYGQQLSIKFLTRLRGEVKFDSLEELKHQMKLDVLQAREVYTGQ